MTSKNKRDDLPAELEYLRAPALDFVGSDREIVGCGQVNLPTFCGRAVGLALEPWGWVWGTRLATRETFPGSRAVAKLGCG